VSDELYSCLDEHPQVEFEIRIEWAWGSCLGNRLNDVAQLGRYNLGSEDTTSARKI